MGFLNARCREERSHANGRNLIPILTAPVRIGNGIRWRPRFPRRADARPLAEVIDVGIARPIVYSVAAQIEH